MKNLVLLALTALVFSFTVFGIQEDCRSDITAKIEFYLNGDTVSVYKVYTVNGTQLNYTDTFYGSLDYALTFTKSNLINLNDFQGEFSKLTKSWLPDGRVMFSYTAKGTIIKQ